MKSLVVVLGMHRSGTSAITRGLKSLGVELGNSLIPAIEGDNAKGFWEDLDINRLNDEILLHFFLSWDSFSLIDNELLEPSAPGMDVFYLKAKALIAEKTKGVKTFGLKDPRICVLLPFWKNVFQSFDVSVSYILAYREPWNVALSLAKRNGFHICKGYDLWYKHMSLALAGCDLSRSFVVSYDALVSNPHLELHRISKFLEVDASEYQEAINEYASDFLDSGLQHNHISQDNLDEVPHRVLELNQFLKESAAFDLRILADNKVRLMIDGFLQQLHDSAENYAFYDNLSAPASSNDQIDERHVVQLFYNSGEGWSEKCSLRQSTEITDLYYNVSFNLSELKGVKKLRLDPLEAPVVMRVDRINIVMKKGGCSPVKILSSNALYCQNEMFYFHTNDPTIYLDISDIDISQAGELVVRMECLQIESEALRACSEKLSQLYLEKSTELSRHLQLENHLQQLTENHTLVDLIQKQSNEIKLTHKKVCELQERLSNESLLFEKSKSESDASLVKVKNELQRTKINLATIESSAVELANENATLKESISKSEAAYREVSDDLVNIKSSTVKLTHENSLLSKSLTDSDNTLTEARAAVEIANEIAADLQQEVVNIRLENQQFLEKYTAMEKQHFFVAYEDQLGTLRRLLHRLKWISARDRELVEGSGLFDADWYLETYQDVVASKYKVDPLLHFLRFGVFEGRNPSAPVSCYKYLQRYPDVRASGINPLLHYLRHGEFEGRSIL